MVYGDKMTKRLKSKDFLALYDLIRNSTTHPEVSYNHPEPRTKGRILEFNSQMPPNKQSNFGSE